MFWEIKDECWKKTSVQIKYFEKLFLYGQFHNQFTYMTGGIDIHINILI